MRGRVSVLKASASCEHSKAKFRSWKRYIDDTELRAGNDEVDGQVISYLVMYF